jgi:hypothetical protein
MNSNATSTVFSQILRPLLFFLKKVQRKIGVHSLFMLRLATLLIPDVISTSTAFSSFHIPMQQDTQSLIV